MPVCVKKASVLKPGRQRVVILLLIKLLTHFTIDSEIFVSLMLCSRRAGTTLLKAPVMSSDSSVATPPLFCHVA